MERMSLEFIDRVAVLKFNHPEVMNAVGGQMLEDFAEACGDAAHPVEEGFFEKAKKFFE